MAGELTLGTRVADSKMGVEGGGWPEWKDAPAGAYMLVDMGRYGEQEQPHTDLWIKDPRGCEGRVAHNVHTITVNDDGTVTVQPSIAPNDTNPGGWHGYLERGVWREV